MTEIIIREFKPRDVSAVIDLLHQLEEVASSASDLRYEQVLSLAAEMANYREVYFNLVAELDERVVGFLSVIFYKTFFHKGGTALINELVVSRTYRGQGVGSMLVTEAKKEAVRRGMDELEVGTERGNVKAQAFYRRMGFNEEYVLLGMELGDTQHGNGYEGTIGELERT